MERRTEQDENAPRLTPRDLYRLRRAHLLAQRASLRAQFAQQQLQELSLELERRYTLLTKEAVLNIQTGAITTTEKAITSIRSSNHASLDAERM